MSEAMISDKPMTEQEKKELDRIENEIKQDVSAPNVKASQITIEDLSSKVMQYCEAQSGVKLYPYQIKFGEAIVKALVLNEGEEITALFSRQSGRLCIS